MGSLAVLDTDEVIDSVLAATPGGADVARSLHAANAAAWSATDRRSLELARVRMAMLLGCAAEAEARTPDSGVDDETLAHVAQWPSDPRFDAGDRAVLHFVEAYLIDVATVDDRTVLALRAHLGDAGLATFVHAVLTVEQRIRLRLMWDRLLP